MVVFDKLQNSTVFKSVLHEPQQLSLTRSVAKKITVKYYRDAVSRYIERVTVRVAVKEFDLALSKDFLCGLC